MKPQLNYYCFDIDENLLFMPTKIHGEYLENNKWVKKSMTTNEYKFNRKSDKWRFNEYSFLEFRDYGKRGNKSFLNDTITAIENKQFGPSWSMFKKCLIGGSFFSIITARGHEPNTIKNTIKYIILNYFDRDELIEMTSNLFAFYCLFNKVDIIKTKFTFKKLLDEYLSHCEYVGISSNYFKNKYPYLVKNGNTLNQELAKKLAISEFVNKINKYGSKVNIDNVSLGFSDDDKSNVKTIYKYFNEINDKYNIDFIVYDTSNPNKIIKRKIKKVKSLFKTI